MEVVLSIKDKSRAPFLMELLRSVVTVADKTATEQVKLIAQLNEKDKSTVMNIIDTMLTKQKFQTFFEQNLQPAN